MPPNAVPRGRARAAAVCVVLAACGVGGSVGERPAGQVSPSRESAETTSDWTPPVVPVPSDPGFRARLGPYAGLILGDDAIVPNGSPEHLAYLEACIESAGFEVDVKDGALSGSFGRQRSFFQRVSDACEQAAVDAGLVKAQEALDDEFLAAQYDAFMLTYECMVSQGYPVGAPPSKDAYLESGGMNWHPYDRLSPIQDISAIEAACPQDVVVLFEMLASGTRP